jgi:hypothetical protein
MSVRGGKTRGLKHPHSALRQTSGDDSQSQDMHTSFDPQSGYRPVLPHEQGYSEFDTPLAAAIIRGETILRDRTGLESPMGNPYGPPMEYFQRTTADDDAHMERQVSLAGGDDVDHGDDPHDIPQPKSEDITQTESEDIPQLKSEDLTPLWLPLSLGGKLS